MTALDARFDDAKHVCDVQRIGKWDVCVSCGSIEGERWEPQSLDDVDYVLSLRHRERVEINALKARIRNLEQMVKQHEARDTWLSMKWAGHIRQLVTDHLASARSRARSIVLEHGTAGVRKSRGSIEILDQDAAVKWCEAHMPEAVHVEKTVRKTPLQGLERELPEGVFLVHQPTDQYFSEPTA